MIYLFTYLMAGCISLFTSFSHPLHVSLTSIEYTANNTNLKIAVKVNTEDFELAMAHNYEIILNLNKKEELKDCDTYIGNYFIKALQVYINDNKQQLNLTHKETEDESTWLYFDVPVKEEIRIITVKNALLLDVFMDQTNMVILTHNGKEKGYKLDFYTRDLDYNINLLSEKAK